MSKEFWQILFILLIAIVATAWGIHGVVHGDKMKKRADYFLVVGMIICGITSFIFLTVSLFLRLTGNWPIIKS